MHVVEKESIPAGDNPFLHDSVSVGLDLGDVLPIGFSDKPNPLHGIYVMASGMNTAHDFYIVNQATGERLGIKIDLQETDNRYVADVPEYGQLISVTEFRQAVNEAGYTDYDGFGYPAKDVNGVLKMDGRLGSRIYPSTSDRDIPDDATHVVWFNK